MLKTSYKAKLPQGWSWPIGAETLSEWLEGVEGAEPVPLHFSDYQIRDSHFRRIRAQGLPYRILSITYSAPFAYWADQWQVRIDPIPSTHKKFVHTRLLSSGLSKVRTWLEASRRNGVSQGRGSCRVLFQESSLKVFFEQKLNDFDDASQAELTDNYIDGTG
jgi:hypothetical protein